MTTSTLSRRASEFLGVALFAAALLWVVALVTWEPTDPVWFFSSGATHPPANFAGLVGAFIAEASFQLVGYTSYLIPAVLMALGWHYFWCRTVDALYTKAIGSAVLFCCLSGLLQMAFGGVEVGGRSFRAGGSIGESVAAFTAQYLNRAGGSIVLLTLLSLAILLTTQVSLGRAFGAGLAFGGAGVRQALGALREWRENRRKEGQRREIIAKHAKKAGVTPDALPVPPRPQPASKPVAKAAAARATESEPPVQKSANPPRDARARVVTPPLPLRRQRAMPRPVDRSSESSAASPCRRSRCSTRRAPNRRSTSAS